MTYEQANREIARLQRDCLRVPQSGAKKPRGISNEQAKLLGELCREPGVPYRGSGMTLEQAAREIARLQG
jgi:hypothetical protein